MSNFDNTNSGALFKNKKRTNDKHPNMRGTVNADGVEYWVSAWTKESRAGEKFVSLALTPKDEGQGGGNSGSGGPAPAPVDDFDDDIPF